MIVFKKLKGFQIRQQGCVETFEPTREDYIKAILARNSAEPKGTVSLQSCYDKALEKRQTAPKGRKGRAS